MKGFDYGGRVRAHLECNNRFGDETYVRKALQLLGALHDSRTTLTRPAPGRVKGHVLALNEATLPIFSRRDLFSDIALEGSATSEMTGWAEWRPGVARL